MNRIKAFFSSAYAKASSVFKSGAAEKAFDKIAGLADKALPIVKKIAELTPNRTDDEIVAAYEQFAVPVIGTLESTPASKRGLVLLDLATEALRKDFPGIATNLLTSAVSLAVSAMKTNG